MPVPEVQRDIVYATRDGQKLLGDLYLPAGKGPHPVLVCVHGGGWTAGARNQFYTWGPYLAERGYAVFSVSYRAASPAKKMFPEAVHDVRAGVQFIRGSAAEYNIDPERVALFGASAGAHLAALVALGQGATALKSLDLGDKQAAVRDDVKALVGFYGVFDMLEQWQGFNLATPTANNVAAFLGVSPPQNRQVYFDASPIGYTTVANSRLAVFLVAGTEDDVVNRAAQTDAFLLALKQAGNFVRTCIVPGAPHYFVRDPIDEPTGFNGFVAPRLLRFLEERL
jgi:acetyl esterase/lipase